MIVKIKIKRKRREDIDVCIGRKATSSRPTRLVIWTDKLFAVRTPLHVHRGKLLRLLSVDGAGNNL